MDLCDGGRNTHEEYLAVKAVVRAKLLICVRIAAGSQKSKQNKIMANPSIVQMRKIVLSELCACFASKSHMTKQELLNSIKRVEVSQSLYKWLLDTGILSSSKGKGASVSLAISRDTILSHFDRYAYREPQQGYTTISRRQATRAELLAEIKRLKG